MAHESRDHRTRHPDAERTGPLSERRGGLWLFVALACAVTWTVWLPVIASTDGAGWWEVTLSDGPLYFLLVAAGTFGPTVAALVVLGRSAGRGAVGGLLRRCLRWRLPPRWYAVAILGPLVAVAAAMALIPGQAALFAPSGETVLGLVIALVTVQLVVGALGEEPGWRGFALPRLQRSFGPLTGSVVLGLAWGGWHLPLFLVADWVDSKGGATFATLGQYLLFTIALSIVMTWVFNNAHGSVLLMILMHAAANTAFGVVLLFPDSAVPEGNILLPGLLASCAAAAAVAVLTRGRLGYRP
jgi:uncharacterized protein